ncbi:hypothetical protein CQ12_38805 [Bradyrhizobium jicamae]|uniref:Uncharacterized protein n=1 Tax=Bradyrhizobium jicamae TaxID=280332 RepID=A0A0R3LB14_9BRAD|nr:hypothetical protein CQ12_38805 [Bradyrhizobium jicamae]
MHSMKCGRANICGMRSLKDKIATAAGHVCRRIVERQRRRVADGDAGPKGQELLRAFEASLHILEGHLAHLLEERDAR